MKLITLNTHSLEEADYPEKLRMFVEEVLREMPDVIALQEVNQNRTAAPVEAERLEESGFVGCREVAGRGAPGCERVGCGAGALGRESAEGGAPGLNIPVRGDNHAYRLGQFLRSEGVSYFWTWVPAKIGYGRYDEGTALFCRFPICGAEWFYSTEARDYENWKTRKVLGICAEIEGKPRRFYSVHMGWWGDGTEPFLRQWERMKEYMAPYAGEECWLMGDFNAPAHVKGEGYELVKKSGWFDTYDLARERDEGITVSGCIDGWRDGALENGMRIDYIWVNRTVSVGRSRVIFNGRRGPVVSDHFGVMVECDPAGTGGGAQEGEQER